MNERSRIPLILAVDDNVQNLQLIGSLLDESFGCDLSLATSGEEAQEILREVTPDLILLDVNMPGMNGFDFCRLLRAAKETRDTPVIFLTAQQATDYILQGFAAGGNDYIGKPFESQELLARVKVHLSLKLRSDELKAALARIKRLEGILPICMFCKKIRNDGDIWQQVDHYLTEHSDALFSHGICPDCMRVQLAELRQKTP